MELHIEFFSFSRMHNTIKIQEHFVGGDHVIVAPGAHVKTISCSCWFGVFSPGERPERRAFSSGERERTRPRRWQNVDAEDTERKANWRRYSGPENTAQPLHAHVL